MEKERLNEKKLDHRNYRKELCEQLVGDFRVKLKGKRLSVSKHVVPERLQNDKVHMIDSIPDNAFRDCSVRSDRNGPGGSKRAVYYCETCPGKPTLHPKKCFKLYHSRDDYEIKYS